MLARHVELAACFGKLPEHAGYVAVASGRLASQLPEDPPAEFRCLHAPLWSIRQNLRSHLPPSHALCCCGSRLARRGCCSVWRLCRRLAQRHLWLRRRCWCGDSRATAAALAAQAGGITAAARLSHRRCLGKNDDHTLRLRRLVLQQPSAHAAHALSTTPGVRLAQQQPSIRHVPCANAAKGAGWKRRCCVLSLAAGAH